eukprot:6484406-Ditylum_brightwellii.AAC.1
MDDLQALLNFTSPGGVETVLTGHAPQLPKLSTYFDSTGGSKEVLRKSDTLCSSHSPSSLLDRKVRKLIGSVCGSVDDPHLTSISCTPNFGEYAKLILDHMPPQGCHSIVGMCQLDILYKCDKIEMNAFNVTCSQDNSPCGGEGHEHD